MPQNPNLAWALFRSIAIVLGVAITLAVGTGFIAGSFVAGLVMFVMAIVAQFAINAITLGVSDRKNQEAEFLAAQVLKEAAERKMPYNLNCAYCNTTNRIGISFDAENIFNCISCQQPNKVYVQFSTVRITTPLTQRETVVGYADEEDSGVTQTTINEPIKMNEK